MWRSAIAGDERRDRGNDLTEPIVRNTIIFANTADSADLGPDLSCNFVSGTEPPGVVPTAFSLIGSVAPATQLDQSGPNLLGQDPQLGPLADNGGSTQTLKVKLGDRPLGNPDGG